MERLTRKSLEYKDTWISDGSLSNIEGVVRGRAIDRLAEFEDFMEETGISDIPELKRILTTNAVWQENQALKERWEKLKEYIIKEINKDGDSDFACAEEDILDKMRELELADLIRRKEK